MSENIAPTFLVPPHSDIRNAEELEERMTITLIGVNGESTEQEFTVTEEGDAYRVTLDPPRTFTPGRYRLVADLDRTRGMTRTLQRFFRLTNTATEQDSLVLIDEYIDWGTVAQNPSEAQNDGVVILKRTAASTLKPGVTDTMSIDITVAARMTAVIRETVPAGFTITNISPIGSVTVIGDAQQIEWNMQLEENITRTVSYSYTVGDDTPTFALFGPVEMRGVPERAIEEMEVVEVQEEESSSFESVVSSESSSSSIDSISAESSSSDFSVSSESSPSSESSTSSESTSPVTDSGSVLQSFMQSFFNGMASLIGAVTFDDDELFFTEDRQWQLLITDEEDFTQAVRDRVLTLERSAAVFDANSAPSFTLVQTDLASDPTVLDGSGNLLTNVALQEVLQTIITDDQIKEAVVKSIIKNEAENIAAQKLDNRSALQEIQEGAEGASGEALQQAVTDVIANSNSTQNELTDIVRANDLATDIVEQVVDRDLTDSIFSNMANEQDAVVLEVAIDAALSASGESSDILTDAVIETVVADTDATTVIRDNVDTNTQTNDIVEAPVLTVNLTGPNGVVIKNVPFHFTVGSVVLVIDPLPAFRPGLYTVEVLVTNPLTGEVTSMYQQFAWGVLAMNSDKDRYVAGETASIDFGVLDNEGEIVCVADLTLDITAPDGSTDQLSTNDDSIETTGTCGLKEAGFIEPDFTTSVVFDQEGDYELVLTADTPNGIRSITSTITVLADSDTTPFSIKRTGATRLWPFAASSMDIDVTFGSDTDGMVSERVPPGFVIVETEPEAEILELDDGTQFIRWTGNWDAGDTESFRYLYDAPDISPQFYLLGPVRILSDTPPTEQ